MIEVISTGPLTTVQDQGRFGYAHLGVPRSGALDAPALAWGNRLVGNPVDAAGLEITMAATTLVGRVALVFAVTGATVEVWVGGRPSEPGRPVVARAGVPVRISAPIYGARAYVAFAGGVAVPPVLGSRSTDTLSGLGPPRVQAGDRLPLGARRVPVEVRHRDGRALDRPIDAQPPTADDAPGSWGDGSASAPPSADGESGAPGGGGAPASRGGGAPGLGGGCDALVWSDDMGVFGRAGDVPGEIGVVPVGAGGRPIVVRFAWGPRDEMFTEDGRRALLGAYRMGVDGNRVGVRLRGEGIGRVDRAELVSEGLVLGAIQVTADGQPLVFLADHPTTGGYPVIGVVDALGVARLAQGRPGDTVIFRADGSGHGSQRRPG